ncbi:MAG: VOC family protein [Xanthomonadales bacterium]|nr:VOC family protein [Xanthomonadales bacterium]
MKQAIFQVSLVVRDYAEAVSFYAGKLGFILLEDSYIITQSHLIALKHDLFC